MTQPKNFMRQRMELLAFGEELGWPRLPVGTNYPPIRAGKGQWERAARGLAPRMMAALRYAKIRRDNLDGTPDTPLSRVVTAAVAVLDPPVPPRRARLVERKMLAEVSFLGED